MTDYNVLVGFWRVDGVEYSNETPLSGRGKADKQMLAEDIRAQHPKAREILPLGTKIEKRSNSTAFIEAPPGAVIRNIFTGLDGEEEPVRTVGTVWFDGAPYDVLLLFSRARGCVLVKLRARIANFSAVNFSNEINPQRLLSELPALLNGVFGNHARDLKLKVREVKPS